MLVLDLYGDGFVDALIEGAPHFRDEDGGPDLAGHGTLVIYAREDLPLETVGPGPYLFLPRKRRQEYAAGVQWLREQNAFDTETGNE